MTIIVTGAARGIGRSVVELMLSSGHRIVAIDLDGSPLHSINHPSLIVLEGDATDLGVIGEACALGGEITGVVANAGISRTGSSDTFTTRQWDEVISLNLSAVFELMRAAARTAVDGASFVAVSSVTAAQGFAGRAAYSASKAGVDGLLRALAVEYAPRIRVNSVLPGFIMTDIARNNIANGIIDDHSIVARTPMGRWGHPDDVARAVAFLVGSESSWITGTSLTVDGGWLALGLGSSPDNEN